MLMSRVAILLICACLSLVSYADSKPNLVLLPLDVSESEMNLVSEFGSALHQGLQDRYTVFFGAAVERELDKEYSKLDCTAESCNQNVAIAFNGELVGDGSVKRVGNGYILKLVIQNVLTNEIIETQTIPCSTCDAFQVITQLKEIGSGKALESNNASVTTRVSETGVNQGQVNRIGTSPTTVVKNSKAILVFDSEPSGAEVWLDGSKIGKTPFQGTDFVKGETYRISLKDDRFKSYIFDVTVTENIVYLPPVTLEPGFGDIMILTETYMPGARVYIDGEAHGEAPYQIKLAAGPHQIYVMNDQKQSLISEVMVKTDQLHEVIITFTSKPEGRYQIKADGHVIEDQVTGLQWARCSLGQEWDGIGCEGWADLLNWTDAIKQASKDKTGGINDWRLPTIKELSTLAFCSSGEPEAFANGDGCQGEFDRPTIDQYFFPNTRQSSYWSSSTDANNGSDAWRLGFDNGYGNYNFKINSYSVRLVRGQ